MTPYLLSVTTIPTSSSSRPSEAQDCWPKNTAHKEKPPGDEGKHIENSLH